MKNSYRLLTLLAVTVLIVAPVSLLAQSSENMTMLGNWGMGGGEIRAVTNQGDLVYYGLGNVLAIVSFEDPANPYQAGSVTLDDMVEDIVWTVIGGETYCVVSGTSLNIVNVTNPLSPSLTSTLALNGYGEGIDVSGTYAYIAAGSSGMEVIDISDPANPASVTVVAGEGSGYAEGINVSSPYAYLANGANCTIYDIDDPTTPAVLGAYEKDGWIQDAMPISNYVYICDWGVGVDVVNVSDPANPVLETTFTNPTNADIMFDGNYGFIASRGDGLTVMDVSTPAAPTSVGTFATTGVVRKVSFGAITIDGTVTGHIFTAEVSGLGAVNVSDAANEMSYSGMVEVQAPADGICYSALVMGNTAYAPYGSGGFRILDVTNPGGMSELGHYASPTNARKVVIKDNIAYLADKSFGIFVLDVSDPASIDSLTAFDDSPAQDIGISGDYVYAAVRDLGVAIVDASTANAPTLVGHISTHWGEGIAVDGDIMAQSTWDKVLFYDISTPATPALMDSVVLSTGTGEVGLHGSYAYIHDFDSLRIFDLNDLSAVEQIGVAFTNGSWDGTAYVEDSYCYVNCETNGVKIFDITDMAAPVEVGHYDGTATARNVFALDGMVYAAEKEGGLSVYSNDLVTSIAERTGMPADFALAQNYPNPFNPVTTIQYSLPTSGMVELAVYNVLGENIRTLVAEAQNAGSYQIRWDGRDEAGHSVSGGLYLYRLNAADQVQTRKMILLK